MCTQIGSNVRREAHKDQFLTPAFPPVPRRLIADKQHIHMNSTKWDTLTTFVKYLGKQGHCLVDETEKGWFVQFIDRSYLKRKEELDKCVRDCVTHGRTDGRTDAGRVWCWFGRGGGW